MTSRFLLALAAGAALTGVSGCGTFGRSETSGPQVVDDEAGIGVNAFLWRASLDTIDFMPLASADPWGGVITTDWFTNPEKTDERFKVTVYILDTRLRADALKAAIVRETLTETGWVTAESTPDTALAIENAILTRARQLRLSTIEE